MPRWLAVLARSLSSVENVEQETAAAPGGRRRRQTEALARCPRPRPAGPRGAARYSPGGRFPGRRRGGPFPSAVSSPAPRRAAALTAWVSGLLRPRARTRSGREMAGGPAAPGPSVSQCSSQDDSEPWPARLSYIDCRLESDWPGPGPSSLRRGRGVPGPELPPGPSSELPQVWQGRRREKLLRRAPTLKTTRSRRQPPPGPGGRRRRLRPRTT